GTERERLRQIACDLGGQIAPMICNHRRFEIVAILARYIDERLVKRACRLCRRNVSSRWLLKLSSLEDTSVIMDDCGKTDETGVADSDCQPQRVELSIIQATKIDRVPCHTRPVAFER